MKITWFYLSGLLIAALLFNACVKEDFKEPPAEGTDPDVEVNSTLEDIKAFYQPGNYVQIDEDLIFSAVVVADDRSGNFFRNLVIQDETGGIQIRFNFTDLHNEYPIGRRLFIRAKDMYISDFNGTLQLGAGIVRDAGGNPTQMDGIPLPLANKFILKGKWNQDVSPTPRQVGELMENDINTLIRLDDVQFRAGDLGETFAINIIDDEGNEIRQTVNRELTSCTGDAPIIVRTSGFADFANTTLPSGSGSVVGVYTVFGDTKQLTIREIEDVNMEDDRCDMATTPISAIRAQFSGQTTTVGGSTVIRGTVISDKEELNIVDQNLIIQDENAGIVVRFNGNHNFPLGSELEIDVSGAQLSQFQGLLQLSNVDLLSVQQLSTNNFPTPIQLTISQLLANFNQYEARLIHIQNVTITKPEGGSTFSFSTLLDDGTGTITMFTRSAASFANTNFPTDVVNITGIPTVGGNDMVRQLSIRNLDDIDGDITDPETLLFEDFQSETPNQPISIAGWTNYAEEGSQLWATGQFQDNIFGTASSFQSPDAANKMWLITPELEIDAQVKLEFESAQAFHVHDGLKVYISNNYDGGDPTSADWTELGANIAGPDDDRWDFVDSGTIGLGQFPGTAHIAFVYEGSSAQGNTTTYRVDNIKVFK